ncbi:heavy-metal-associated domain-containing protein [Mycolicibacterium insubricum]|uniref:heavy-metal-associated domain-containing protein n=1 Tax=Mycolicibacterium insubricum TaxID=444597 RepID=UPI0021F37BC0|nr:heavy-metal-associated domain-containing protein [Mycolicibacterium insubricum]MCV7080354.1 heavy-metal-associated domain-containing protein [Mycolicibacterium insubricum]
MSQTRTYQVRGMTCGHCAGAVTAELEKLGGVTAVAVEVVPQGDSPVTVTSTAALTDDAVRAAWRSRVTSSSEHPRSERRPAPPR